MRRPGFLACFLAMLGPVTHAADPPRAPKVWAVVVGIDSYEDPAIPACKGASADAREIRRWLVETAGWDEANVLQMDDNSPRSHGPKEQQIPSLRPTRANLDWAVKEWLGYRVRPGDVVLISFAGQAIGGRDGDPSSLDGVLPIDARSAAMDRSAWPIQEAIDGLASKGENPVLVWLDTSLSGRGRPAGNLLGRRASASQFLMEITRWPGVSAWIAADGSPATEPSKPRERGAFAAAVLPALGTADRPGNILGALFAAGRDSRLGAQGFRSAGGLGPEWSLWPKTLASMVRPPSELLLQRGHADRITAVAFSADGATMITASRDSTIKVWRVADRVLVRTLAAHTIGVTALALSPDSTKLASADGAGRVILWSLTDLRPTRFLGPPPHSRGVADVEFLGDGSGFASLDDDGRAVAWTLDGAKIVPKVLAEGATAIAAGESEIAVAVAPKDDRPPIRVFDVKGNLRRSLAGPGGLITSGSLAIRGDRIAAGNKMGAVGIWNLEDGTVLGRVQAKDPIESVRLSNRAAYAASGDAILVLWSDRTIPSTTLALSGRAAEVLVTDDGKALAASTTAGDLSAWDLSDPKAVSQVSLEASAVAKPSTVLAVSPRRQLISGDEDGGIRTWDWPGGRSLARIAPHRGKIDVLDVSRDGRHLAQIDHDRGARLWDLREGRDLRTIRGDWNSLAFLPDGRSLAMTRGDGTLCLVDRATTEPTGAAFEPPRREGGAASSWGFGPVATSPDGTLIAAGSPQGPLACIWPAAGGAPTLTLREHEDRISAVAFSDDSKHCLTASHDGSVKIWPVAGGAPRWTLRAEAGDDPEGNPAVTAAKIAPKGTSRVVTGHLDGRVLLWDLREGREPKPVLIGQLEGAVHALAFTPDGARMIACGSDKTVRSWRMDGPNPPAGERRFEPQHTEQVNALVAWPDGRLLASAGDDSTIRFWAADAAKLLGTLALSTEDGSWVAYTPDGKFDSAPGGETQVTYIEADRILPLDQADDESRVFGLGGLWLDGKAPEGRSFLLVSRPPPLWLAPPSRPRDGEVDLTVRLADPGLENLRVYLNDKPVRDHSDFRDTADPAVKAVTVRLAPGENRLVAMASRPGPGALHGRSNVVSVRGPALGEAAKGVVHSLALGISKYERNRLQFADRDAKEFAEFLSKHAVGEAGRSGLKLVLRDDQVTPEVVEDALMTIRERSRPEDTVVVFLAGHTDVRRDRFCLLLSRFPFALDPREPSAAPERDDPGTVLMYSAIYRALSRMDALKRLVVIDACQAEAVYDDPGVRRIQDKVDDGAHRARTSYLMAARRGESAGEAGELKHGLLTHLLLRGMGSDALEPEPGGKFGHADADADGIVTTEELRRYVDVNLPVLTDRVALLAQRANPEKRTETRPDPSRTQAATTPFPLIKLPR